MPKFIINIINDYLYQLFSFEIKICNFVFIKELAEADIKCLFLHRNDCFTKLLNVDKY